MRTYILTIATVILLPALSNSTTIHVPADQPTIQAGIDAAVDGDTVLVAPGTYVENIDFKGKAIVLTSEQGAEVSTIDGNQTGSVVICQSGEGPGTVLEGFTITNGSGNAAGGGMYNYQTSPTVKNCIFSNNESLAGTFYFGEGGGMCNYQGSPTVDNCVFSKNTARGIIIYGSPGNLTFPGCGGGMSNGDSNPSVTDCIFIGNEALGSGGHGIGGGMCNSNSNPTVTNCLFVGNRADHDGGAMYNGYHSNLKVINCTFSGNVAAEGGGLYSIDSSPTVTNCILWDDTPDEIYNDNSFPTVTFCNVQGGYPGTGNIDSDPLFVDPVGGDLHLTFNSPCRASGDNTAVTSPTDFEGDPRIAYGTVDMGADEFYTHLYHTGDDTPGGSVKLKFTDLPGASPVAFWIAFDALESPIQGAYGNWWLLPPMTGPFALGSIPSSGVYVLPGTIPASPPGPYTLYLQATIGMKLTSLCTIAVH